MLVFLVESTLYTVFQIVTDDPRMVADILNSSRFVAHFRVESNDIPQYDMFKGYDKSEKRLRSV